MLTLPPPIATDKGDILTVIAWSARRDHHYQLMRFIPVREVKP